ncbi:MAG: endonuclease/exonuclease/phosphatase family protein [Burkholderiaceae bacterium]
MQQEIRFASFNVRNLALPGTPFYRDHPPYTADQYAAKADWIAHQIDMLDADVIGFQEIFSQDALRDVLTRTRCYRDARHLGAEPEAHAGGLTPAVALVSRLPVEGDMVLHRMLPRGLSVALPGVPNPADRFTRPVLQARIRCGDDRPIEVLVVHLKSTRPDTIAEAGDDAYEAGMAALRSLIRRGTEALGLRYLLTEHMERHRAPLAVLGDFNDVAQSAPLQIITGGRPGLGSERDALFDSRTLLSRRSHQPDIGFTHAHDGVYETIDHILLSADFHPASPDAIGRVVDVAYLNDHLALRRPDTSDHGIVSARVRLFETFGQGRQPADA